MKRVMILGIIAILALLLAPVSAISDPAGPPGGLEVKIVDQPVEVTGDVKVTNDSSNPVPVKIEENKCWRRIVNFHRSIDIKDNDSAAYITIPEDLHPKEGEILVVETVSVDALLSDDQEDSLMCGIYYGGPDFYLATWPMQAVNYYATYGNRAYASTKQLRVYLPYTNLNSYSIALNFSKSGDNVIANGSLYGYIVSDECPAP